VHDPEDTIREYKLTEEQREKLEELRPHVHKEGDMKEKIKRELKSTEKGQELENLLNKARHFSCGWVKRW
jgi:DNA-binding HxlR family transcriptional regulator